MNIRKFRFRVLKNEIMQINGAKIYKKYACENIISLKWFRWCN